MKKYTVEEFRVYLESKDSKGDIHYYLSEEAIDEANQLVKDLKEPEEEVDNGSRG